MSRLQKSNKGFTIIEVLIVLAIAALIMLIVFLAVPALQRNSRNNARNNEASRISAAIVTCLANRNNDVNSCDDPADLQIGTRTHLDTVQYVGGYIVALSGSTTTAQYGFGVVCNDSGSAAIAGGGAKSHAVVYQIEAGGTPTNRCVSG